MEVIRVIIADDSDFVRDGMKIILDIDPQFHVVACASNGREAVEVASHNEADVILMDIQMPEMDGIEATREIVNKNLGKVLILTTFDDYDLVERAIKCGAKGYLIKNHTPDHLKQMIKAIYHGVHVMDEKIFEKIGDRASLFTNEFNESIFTSREMDIIKAIAEGRSNKEVAEKLFLSEGTIKNHISTILEKCGLSHRTQLAVYYLTGKKLS